MPWRKSLVVAALDLASGQLQTIVFTFLLTTNPQLMGATQASIAGYALVLNWIRILLFAIATFFVVAWALRSASERKGRVRAEDVIEMLDEDQVEELKRLLIAPSQMNK